MKVKNYMEEVIDHILVRVLKDMPEICGCEHCVSDIKAIALNMVKPKYVATPVGEVYTKVNELSMQFEVDAVKAIAEAIEKVKASPRHR